MWCFRFYESGSLSTPFGVWSSVSVMNLLVMCLRECIHALLVMHHSSYVSTGPLFSLGQRRLDSGLSTRRRNGQCVIHMRPFHCTMGDLLYPHVFYKQSPSAAFHQ